MIFIIIIFLENYLNKKITPKKNNFVFYIYKLTCPDYKNEILSNNVEIHYERIFQNSSLKLKDQGFFYKPSITKQMCLLLCNFYCCKKKICKCMNICSLIISVAALFNHLILFKQYKNVTFFFGLKIFLTMALMIINIFCTSHLNTKKLYIIFHVMKVFTKYKIYNHLGLSTMLSKKPKIFYFIDIINIHTAIFCQCVSYFAYQIILNAIVTLKFQNIFNYIIVYINIKLLYKLYDFKLI
ncbi:hypothetical protein AGLY_009925 [Aphis glycines]|uniref:Uncharacterized protein n=1 Tax=Aphis glycines TaxID=307491 RepID=A0A6G0TI52_APHGL|nr:hypothetical protein AGLY_009925 [Aphis glycines]